MDLRQRHPDRRFPVRRAQPTRRGPGDEPGRVRARRQLLGRRTRRKAYSTRGDARHVAWEEQLKAADAGLDDPVRRVGFIRRQVLRAGTPLRLMAQNLVAQNRLAAGGGEERGVRRGEGRPAAQDGPGFLSRQTLAGTSLYPLVPGAAACSAPDGRLLTGRCFWWRWPAYRLRRWRRTAARASAAVARAAAPA
ncbi:DUF6245 family protein [Streptomyces sp. NPDC007896]|uniref:DUF6245 family protein n=1 Tax=Streptomyces sp. NPDC007896 TaxID=3364784 RepID=UPI0036E92E44